MVANLRNPYARLTQLIQGSDIHHLGMCALGHLPWSQQATGLSRRLIRWPMHRRQPTVVNVGYRSTNYWVVSALNNRLLIDIGWPGTMGELRAQLRRMDVALHQLRYALATHYHIDHAGLGQELKLAQVPLLIVDVQLPWVEEMKRWTKPADRYVPITTDDSVVVDAGQAEQRLRDIGIDATVLHTPGHSDDSVSVVMEDGRVFTGDLPSLDHAEPDRTDLVAVSWRDIIAVGGHEVYPAHGPIRPLAR